MNLDLTNHVTVVTGGASGIGRAAVEAFRAEGGRVAVWDLQPPDDVATMCDLFVRCDVAKLESVESALAETEKSLGQVEHLVHAAAIGSGHFGFPFTEVPVEAWPRVLEVNIMGMTHVAHAVAPGMRERRAGTCVFVASVAGQIGSPTDPPYSASKAANINFAQCMAKDLAAFGVRVNTVCPGMVQTPLNRRVWQGWYDRQPPELRKSYEDWAGEKVRQVVPLQRWQTPVDIANMIVFLSSPCAAQVTGQTINVDGGFVMHW